MLQQTLPLHTVYARISLLGQINLMFHPSAVQQTGLVSPDLDFSFSNTRLFMPAASHTVISLTLMGSFEAHSLVSSGEQG